MLTTLRKSKMKQSFFSCIGVLIAASVQARSQEIQPGDVISQLSAPSCCPMGATFDGSALWIVDRKVNKLFRICPKTGKVLKELSTPGLRPTGLTWDGRHLWIADRENLELFRLNPKTAMVDKVLKIPVKAPRGLAWDGECLYLASAREDTISCLDPDDGTVVRKIQAPDNAVTGLTYDGKHLWAADRNWDEIYMIDPEEGHVIGILESPGPHPFGLAWDGQHIWNVDYQTQKIYALNITKGNPRLHLQERRLRVEYVVHFQNQGPDWVQAANFFIALPQNRYNQNISQQIEFTTTPAGIHKDRWNQPIAYFREKDIPPGKHLKHSMAVDATLHRTRVWIIPEKVRSLGSISKKIRHNYLGNNTKFRINNPIVREAVRRSVGNETNPYWIARKIYQFVLKSLAYKRSGGWDSVPLLLERGTGSCSEYAFVLISLCRAAGIPARWVGGVVTRGDDAFVDNVFHRWAEIFLPGYGWIPVDPDRGDRKNPRNQALGFGNLDNTLLVTTVSGGESEYLGWKYNGNVQWSFRGRTKVYVEQIGELAPQATHKEVLIRIDNKFEQAPQNSRKPERPQKSESTSLKLDKKGLRP